MLLSPVHSLAVKWNIPTKAAEKQIESWALRLPMSIMDVVRAVQGMTLAQAESRIHELETQNDDHDR
jgi:hypothetical protein